MTKLEEEFENVAYKIDNEGLGYYITSYASASSMPDEESRELFKMAEEALDNFVSYVESMRGESEC